jgi:hypothetical protein
MDWLAAKEKSVIVQWTSVRMKLDGRVEYSRCEVWANAPERRRLARAMVILGAAIVVLAGG